MPPVNSELISLIKDVAQIEARLTIMENDIHELKTNTDWLGELTDDEGAPVSFAQELIGTVKMIQEAAPMLRAGFKSIKEGLADETEALPKPEAVTPLVTAPEKTDAVTSG